MSILLEFPARVFPEWGALAQEMTVALYSAGATPTEIRAIVDRLQKRWEPHGVAHATGEAEVAPDGGGLDDRIFGLYEHELYLARHWKTQSAKVLIALAVIEYRRLAPG